MQFGKRTIFLSRLTKWVIILALLILSLVLRMALIRADIRPFDINTFASWYDYIHTHGGFLALKDNFANYNASYLYLLALATYIPLPETMVIRLISVLFDYLLALFVYLIVRLKYQQSFKPIIAGLLALFLPTVFIDSALWGQCDSIYVSLCLGCLYFLLSERPIKAFILFGLALSFKPQSLFLFPLLIILQISEKRPWKLLLIIPIVYLLTMIPACLVGRNFLDLLTAFRSNIVNPHEKLTLNAPTIYQWIPETPAQFMIWQIIGVSLTLLTVTILSVLILARRKRINRDLMIKISLVIVLIISFLIPQMHERYFYLADILSLLYLFYFPDYFYIAILLELSSATTYMIYLTGSHANIQTFAALVLGIILITTRNLLKSLYAPEKCEVNS